MTPHVETIRVPAALRSLIVEHKLAANDIAILLLIIERTMDNVKPPSDDALLAIRYIAEQNGCSDKGAWNSVMKLKELDLVKHEVSSTEKKRSGKLRLNLAKF